METVKKKIIINLKTVKKKSTLNLKDKPRSLESSYQTEPRSLEDDLKLLALQKGRKNKLCVVCGKQANFAPAGATTPMYCKNDKIPGCVDVKHKKCTFPSCPHRKTFGFPNSKPERCGKHPIEGMIDLNSKRCKECDKRPNFGLPGTKSATHCSQHALPEMEDIVHYKCHICKLTASFGYKGGKPTRCSRDKLLDMIDLRHEYCQIEECPTYASYGIPGNKPVRCLDHRQVGDIINPTKRCQIPKCGKLAIYGYTSPTHCKQHASSEEIDLIQQACIGCGLPYVLDKNRNCPTCDPTLYHRVRLAKQKKVRDFFDFNHMKYISYDKIVERGICHKKRPDFVFDCVTHMMVVEVDEDQHYGYECEQARMCDIGYSLGMRTVFIRFNIDKYKPVEGKAETREYKRFEKLKQVIEYFHQDVLPTDVACCVTYMYYDGDDPEEWCKPARIC